jgi:hypothetical protein
LKARVRAFGEALGDHDGLGRERGQVCGDSRQFLETERPIEAAGY